jgi:hypothetical protein
MDSASCMGLMRRVPTSSSRVTPPTGGSHATCPTPARNARGTRFWRCCAPGPAYMIVHAPLGTVFTNHGRKLFYPRSTRGGGLKRPYRLSTWPSCSCLKTCGFFPSVLMPTPAESERPTFSQVPVGFTPIPCKI